MDPDGDIVRFAQNYQANFPVGMADRMTAGTVMQFSPMMRPFVPFMLFIDRNGIIQAQYSGGDPFLANETEQDKSIREEVEKLLSKPPFKSAQAKHSPASKKKKNL